MFYGKSFSIGITSKIEHKKEKGKYKRVTTRIIILHNTINYLKHFASAIHIYV